MQWTYAKFEIQHQKCDFFNLLKANSAPKYSGGEEFRRHFGYHGNSHRNEWMDFQLTRCRQCCCESVFSTIKLVKSKHCASLTHTRQRACAVGALSARTEYKIIQFSQMFIYDCITVTWIIFHVIHCNGHVH